MLKAEVEINLVQVMKDELAKVEGHLHQFDWFVKTNQTDWLDDQADEILKTCGNLKEILTQIENTAHNIKVKVMEA